MAKRNVFPETVNPVMAYIAMNQTNEINALYTHYIIAMYRSSSNISPGCDKNDLLAWCYANAPEKISKMRGRNGKIRSSCR